MSSSFLFLPSFNPHPSSLLLSAGPGCSVSDQACPGCSVSDKACPAPSPVSAACTASAADAGTRRRRRKKKRTRWRRLRDGGIRRPRCDVGPRGPGVGPWGPFLLPWVPPHPNPTKVSARAWWNPSLIMLDMSLDKADIQHDDTREPSVVDQLVQAFASTQP